VNAVKKFSRTVEDFHCEQCGQRVRGDGYTNHCPHCLYSKHVDIDPGDRQATCLGLMAPVAVEVRRDQYRLLHRCQRCGFEKWNRTAADDDFAAILQIMREV
jgi:ribosomal protein L37AE/L43A